MKYPLGMCPKTIHLDLEVDRSIAWGTANLYIHYGNKCAGSSGRWQLIDLKASLKYVVGYIRKVVLARCGKLSCRPQKLSDDIFSFWVAGRYLCAKVIGSTSVSSDTEVGRNDCFRGPKLDQVISLWTGNVLFASQY